MSGLRSSDDVASRVYSDTVGCSFILLAPSVQALQLLINIRISELHYLDMAINVKKSALVRDIKMSVLML